MEHWKPDLAVQVRFVFYVKHFLFYKMGGRLHPHKKKSRDLFNIIKQEDGSAGENDN